jgi:OOP family OmpA-OmpF porin
VKNAGTERELALSPVLLTPIPIETAVQKDRDDDGVPDSKDKCPDEKGSKKNFGCPDIQARFNELAKMVFFKTASAELLPASIRPLTEAYDILLKYSNTTLDIEGHTDNRAGAVYNKDLSHRRANSVKAFFVTRGLNARRFTTAGYGLERPIADNSTEEGRALNRRVAIRATFHE